MGRVFISAGHGGYEGNSIDQGVVAGGTTEAQEMIQIRDLILPELRSRGFQVLSVPDDLSLSQSIDWVNYYGRDGDIALEIHTDAFSNPSARGASVFYIASNTDRRSHAELLLFALLRRVPELPSRGAKSDTTSALGQLAFCRRVVMPSLLMQIGFLTNPDDRYVLQNKRQDIALGIADGLASWSRAVTGTSPTAPTGTTDYPIIDINVNGGLYGDRGIIVNGNAYIPIELVDQLSIDLSKSNIRRIQYHSNVYIKAVDLRDFNISVNWDAETRTVILRSSLSICPGMIDRIMGHGNTSEVQLKMFLGMNNENGLKQFPDLPRLYREEGTIEGVNYDIAFCQMCLETNFLQFTGGIRPEQNNFAGLGGETGSANGVAVFPSARIGVRAQIQHLKAYASTEPLVQEIVDPRFRFVTRGIAPLITQLNGRWSADMDYGDKIIAILRRLYESVGLT
jgi:hypothetical protein